MLNNDSLEQLRALKQQISAHKQELEAQKVRATGTVKGSLGRFGFVTLEDGRDIYLPPEQMQRVFPDDHVQIEVIDGSDGKPSAVVEKLLNSPLREFTGHYLVRDKAHFVEPDLPRLSRWLFIPPKQRGAAAHGDLVRCRISRHPLPDGRPQARVEQVIGAPGSDGIECRYALARFQLPGQAPEFADGDLAQPDFAARRDLTALPFVTIDGADTQDMDDALYAERRGDGWTLWVAIADPGAWIVPGSPQEQAIAARAATVYLPGLTVAMLPERLANERCSLQPDSERLALVCALQVAADGRIDSYEFCEARIRSHAKLDYAGAALQLDDAGAPAQPWSDTVRELGAAATALQRQRGSAHLLMPDQPDYRPELDAHGRISAIRRLDKTSAHRVVEECMVATNRCAADYLRETDAIFVCHNGFRSERRDAVARLMAEQLPELNDIDVGALSGYVTLLQALERGDNPLPLRATLIRFLERSQLRTRAAPHFGMGLPCYTTITSPIRKYSDFLLHRLIKAKLRGEQLPQVEEQQLTALQERNDRVRQAAQLAEQWLHCEYLQRQGGAELQGSICHVNSSGFSVRLDDTGIEGFVDLRHTGEKFSFDTHYLRLSSATRQFQLEQSVAVTVAAIDMKRRSITFQLPAAAAAG